MLLICMKTFMTENEWFITGNYLHIKLFNANIFTLKIQKLYIFECGKAKVIILKTIFGISINSFKLWYFFKCIRRLINFLKNTFTENKCKSSVKYITEDF